MPITVTNIIAELNRIQIFYDQDYPTQADELEIAANFTVTGISGRAAAPKRTPVELSRVRGFSIGYVSAPAHTTLTAPREFLAAYSSVEVAIALPDASGTPQAVAGTPQSAAVQQQMAVEADTLQAIQAAANTIAQELNADNAALTGATSGAAAALGAKLDNIQAGLNSMNQTLQNPQGFGSIPQSIGGIGASINSLSGFPIMVDQVGNGFPSAPSGGGGGGGGASGSPTQLVTAKMQAVLGWKGKPDDAKGFVGALMQSFTCQEIEGHTECRWTPRTYAVATDLAGGITGAQASLYTRAQVASDKALPLLDGLYPLVTVYEPDDLETIRSIIRERIPQVVQELGWPGGPRIARLDQLFFQLLGSLAAPGRVTTEPDNIDKGSLIGALRDEFGFVTNVVGQGNFANTVDDEQNLSNFRILSDYLTSLRQTWEDNKRFFANLGANSPFFGTQLVQISRSLSVIAEAVDEVGFTLDSVFIGQDERQTLPLVFPQPLPAPPFPQNTNLPPMYLDDLLTWITNFATDEGPSLIQDGGKYAVQNTFLPTVQTLATLAAAAQLPGVVLSLPIGYQQPRVQAALQNLSAQLFALVNLAAPLQHAIVAIQTQ
ncbi:MAG TPA: hypothetical protein VKU00_15605 [Chthonomonadaceae bacterium]|nr:hypothetical protein [Chthonomonadaceae bacterium]